MEQRVHWNNRGSEQQIYENNKDIRTKDSKITTTWAFNERQRHEEQTRLMNASILILVVVPVPVNAVPTRIRHHCAQRLRSTLHQRTGEHQKSWRSKEQGRQECDQVVGDLADGTGTSTAASSKRPIAEPTRH
jgi:hypothetical protein